MMKAEINADLGAMVLDVIPDKVERKVFTDFYSPGKIKSFKEIALKHGLASKNKTYLIDRPLGSIRSKYGRELLAKYGDVLSSAVRRTKEGRGNTSGPQVMIPEIMKLSVSPGDSISVIFERDMAIQGTILEVETMMMKLKYIGYNAASGNYVEKTKRVWYEDIYDYRTQQKKVVEIRLNICDNE